MKKIFIIVICLFSLGNIYGQFDLLIFEEGKLKTYYRDQDGDSFGDPNISVELATEILGWVSNRLDCDDTNSDITIPRFYFPDIDGDGFGSNIGMISSCAPLVGYVTNNLDNCPTVYFATDNGCPSATGLTTHDFGDENYVYEEILKVASTEDTYNNVVAADKIRNITYFDGLGRKKQSRAIGQSPLGKDIVLHIEYDKIGRQVKNYLPFTSSQNNGIFEANGKEKTIAFYNTPKYGNTTNPYSEKLFDKSPLNKVVETGAPGAAWLASDATDFDHTVKVTHQTNTATTTNYKVRWYKVTLSTSYTPTLTNPSPTYYPIGYLYKTVTKNENWNPASGKLHTTATFKNKFGQVILKRTYANIGNTVTPHDTYYVYDIYNNISYIIPPKVTTSNGVSATELNALCFQYKYDKYNRLVEKKLPGKGWEYIVYDKLDRPILTQDAIQRAKTTKEWLYTKFDVFGRQTYTGIYKDNRTREQVQTSAQAHAVTHESRATSILEYTNNAYPTAITANDAYTANYYDNYNFHLAGLSIPNTVYGITTTNNVNSLPTGSKERVLKAGTNYWITTIIGYDDMAREIYTASKNTYLGTTDTNKMALDFVGNITESSATHHVSNETVRIKDTFTYDTTNRLLTQKQQINNQPEELIIKNHYDELGVLESKKIGNTEITPLQTVNYKYNIRGWLTGINDVNAIGTDLFTFKINYTSKDIPANISYKATYNGNIAETVWRTKNDLVKRGTQYRYDALNRIQASNTKGNEDLSSSMGTIGYETFYNYDKNGNLSYLFRGGKNNLVDNLTYIYPTSSNKLAAITDDTGNSEGAQGTANYTYEPNNGNLTKDTSKGITNIEYNYLDLPTKVEFGASRRIEYIYTATGTKLEKKVTNGVPTTTIYANGFIYENDILKHFGQPEGYVEVNSGTFTYVYQYTDHLGNIRLNYANNGSRTAPNLQIKEENAYYPFGMKMQGFNNTIVGTQNDYKFNGKEYQDEEINGKRLDWYDYGARNYDATIGRFFNIDPLAGSPAQVDKSPYAYTWNNPVNLTDPDGMHPNSIGQGSTTYDCTNGGCGAGFDSGGNFVVSGKIATAKKENTKGGKNDNASNSSIDEDCCGGLFKKWINAMNTLVQNIGFADDETLIALKAQVNTESKKFEDTAVYMNISAGTAGDYLGISGVSRLSTGLSQNSSLSNYYASTNSLLGSDYSVGSDSASAVLFFGTFALGGSAGSIYKGTGNLSISVYRVYGGEALINGRSYSLLNPNYVPFYRNFAGLPLANTGTNLIKASVQIKNVRVGKPFASPIWRDGVTGGLPLEFYIRYKNLTSIKNVTIKSPF